MVLEQTRNSSASWLAVSPAALLVGFRTMEARLQQIRSFSFTESRRNPEVSGELTACLTFH
jgi:hypothetical protein